MMSKYKDDVYVPLISELIGDIYYSNATYTTKISTIRRYTEIVIRKILNYSSDKYLTLGDKKIKEQLSKINNSEYLLDALKGITAYGNNNTHTQNPTQVTKHDFDNAADKLFDIYAFLLINYFEAYEFGTRNDVMSSFSLLPPVIREKVLSFLYKKDSTNIAVIDKLVLAKLKCYNLDVAKKWVEEKKEELLQLNTISKKAFNEMEKKYGTEIVEMLQSNMYECCLDKVSKVNEYIRHGGIQYLDFESALPFYNEKGRINSVEKEIEEFNNIMTFFYIGRKE